jgi:hypothetical protein
VGDKLDREAMERVLRRAQELSRDELPETDEPGVVDEELLIEAAGEAGIDPAAVRRSLALERLSAETEPSAADRVVGPRTIVASTVVEADADDVLALLDAWLSASGKLVAIRRADGTTEWMPRTGVWAALSRVKRPPLTASAEEADRVVAEVTPIDGHTATAVRLTIDRASDRSSAVNTGVAVSGAGVLGSVAELTALVPGFLLVSLPAVGLGGWLAHGGRRRADAMIDDVDRLLGVIQNGERPPSMIDRLRRKPGPQADATPDQPAD